GRWDCGRVDINGVRRKTGMSPLQAFRKECYFHLWPMELKKRGEWSFDVPTVHESFQNCSRSADHAVQSI
ncbi:hypothetical protein, partial [Shimia aestuarii]|uniref:hypothetical protein n=1 Tax=Shimia aestuarii TaxID=254406 RepID=UPI001FB50DE1